MTRVYLDRAAKVAGQPRTRALIVGAGRYPHAKTGSGNRPILPDLSSVTFSVRELLRRLIVDWRCELDAPLLSVDLLLSSADEPGECQWTSLDVPGEATAGTIISYPTLANLQIAIADTLAGATAEDCLLIYFCGHGFWKSSHHFFLSEFGSAPLGGWGGVIDLDALRLGLRTMPPRTQWVFQDCCSDMPRAAFDLIASNIGDPVIRSTIQSMLAANALGSLSQFGMISSTIGVQAFGMPGKPTRFAEMLLEAIEGAGAIGKRDGTVWWVTSRGIEEAMQLSQEVRRSR
jgi:hypothetical protein